jgi:diguanylate cyclase (GGDEF)-like protein/PAS domain S-box-containing protein
MSASSAPPWVRRGGELAVALAFFTAAHLGWAIEQRAGPVAVVWPAAGIAVAAVLLGGRRMLPAIAAGALAAGITHGQPAVVVFFATLAAVLEPLLALVILRRIGFRVSMRRVADVFAFVGVAALLSTAAGATLGALGLLGGASVGAGDFGWIWRDWWAGDFGGVMIVGSALLVAASAIRGMRLHSALTTAALGAGVGLLSLQLLSAHGSLRYLLLPLLFVLAFLFGQSGAAAGGLAAAVAAVLLTAGGHGVFAGPALDQALIRALIFVGVGTITAQLVAAAESERRLAERAVDRLAESQSALAEAQQLARLGSFDIDLRTERGLWSRELERILGQGPDELASGWASWQRCVHPNDRERVEHLVSQAYQEGGSASVVHRIVRADGQVRTVEVRMRFEQVGDSVRVVGTCQDITALKLAEERFRSLFHSAPYPLVVINAQGTIALSNQRAHQTFGVDGGALSGCSVEQLILSSAGDGGHWFDVAFGPAGRDGIELELVARRRDGQEFPVEVSLTPLVAEEGTLVSVAIRDVTEIRATAATLNFQARHDALTGLPNRMMFLETLEQALARATRGRRPVALVFLDLDDFKLVNDRRGHAAGDALLRALTPRLTAAVRLGDTVGRLGGDEFLVLCEDLATEADAVEIGERLVGAAREPLEAAGFEHTISISAGVVFLADASGMTVPALLRDADAAMYAAKDAGKGHAVVFDETMRERLVERVAIESALRGARERAELELVYQPVIKLTSRQVVAVEALLRWRHPVRGLLAPREFMPVAESSGLIAEIGEWVLDEACRQAAAWSNAVGPEAAVPVSVNISAHQLTRTDLTEAVARSLQESGLPAGLLQLEVTESTLLEDMDSARQELMRLKELGVRLVVDDFGTGYSSLSVLRDLMIDGLKLDPSFVEALGQPGSGTDGAAMFDALLGMGDALAADVTAEGVETWAQAHNLRRHGCSYAQGYLFGRPGPPDDVTALIAAGQQDDQGSLVS